MKIVDNYFTLKSWTIIVTFFLSSPASTYRPLSHSHAADPPPESHHPHHHYHRHPNYPECDVWVLKLLGFETV